MLTDARISAILDTEFAAGDKLSLHSAFSAVGANELTGGTYARQTITWAAAGGRTKASIGYVDAMAPAGSTVGWLGVWNAAGTVFRGMFPNGGVERGFQLDLANNRVFCEGCGLNNGDRVAFTGTTVPAGLVAGTPYWVVGVTLGDPDYVQVSATQGGTAIDITAQHSADVRMSKLVLENYAADGTHRVTALSISM